MGEYDVSTIQVDPSQVRQSWEKMADHDPVGLTPFSKALNTAAGLASLFGPTVDVALSGSPKAAGIFNGVLSGFMNSGTVGAQPYANWSTPGSMPTMGGTMSPSAYGFKGLGGATPQAAGASGSGYGFKGLGGGMPSTAPGYPGGGGGFSGGGSMGGMGGGMGSAGIGGPGMSDASNLDAQASSLLNQNMYFLGIQTKLQNVNMVVQAMSNIEKVRSESILATVRNIGR